MPITAVIIDDEPECSMYLSYLLAKMGSDIQVLGIADSVPAGISLIEEKKPDLLFLDIFMPPQTGFDLLAAIPEKNFEVIFCTANNDRATEAFRVAAFDYLLKPIVPELLKDSLTRLKYKKNPFFEKQVELATEAYLHNYNRLMVSTVDSIELLDFSDILYIESKGNYVYFYLVDGLVIISSKGLSYYTDILPPHIFFNCNRGICVNGTHVQRVIKGDGGIIVLKNGKEIPLSVRRKDAFLKFLKGEDFS